VKKQERRRKSEVCGISFARGMVARIDAAAVRSGTNRSALVRAGVARVLEAFERPTEAEAHSDAEPDR
jgi:hypothetical protein